MLIEDKDIISYQLLLKQDRVLVNQSTCFFDQWIWNFFFYFWKKNESVGRWEKKNILLGWPKQTHAADETANDITQHHAWKLGNFVDLNWLDIPLKKNLWSILEKEKKNYQESTHYLHQVRQIRNLRKAINHWCCSWSSSHGQLFRPRIELNR